jgi:hypothetical protein
VIRLAARLQAVSNKNGVLTFLTNNNDRLDPKSAKEIKMDLGEVMSSDFMNTNKVEFEIKVQ